MGRLLRRRAFRAVAELAPFALSRKIEIDLAGGAAVRSTGYPGLIAILLRNLIDNAIRYSTEGASVRLGEGDRGKGLSVTVTFKN